MDTIIPLTTAQYGSDFDVPSKKIYVNLSHVISFFEYTDADRKMHSNAYPTAKSQVEIGEPDSYLYVQETVGEIYAKIREAQSKYMPVQTTSFAR